MNLESSGINYSLFLIDIPREKYITLSLGTSHSKNNKKYMATTKHGKIANATCFVVSKLFPLLQNCKYFCPISDDFIFS